jgi:hypothetical protein
MTNRVADRSVTSEADIKLMSVYGDYIHQNDGTHLDGEIADDTLWQERWA